MVAHIFHGGRIMSENGFTVDGLYCWFIIIGNLPYSGSKNNGNATNPVHFFNDL